MNPTTLDNPGAFKTAYSLTLGALFLKLIRLLINGKFGSLRFAMVAEPLNYFSFRILKNSHKSCPICYHRGPFVHLYNARKIAWNSACPVCDSRSRHRGLYTLYADMLKPRAERGRIRVLHFAPEPIFFSLFRHQSNIEYLTTDYFLGDVDFQKEDIQSLSFKDLSMDVVLCNHVIEHVADDEAAFREIKRILTARGVAIITIPGDYTRMKTVRFNHLRFNGHYRDYGLDVLDKMRSIFGEVEAIDLSRYNIPNHHAIRKNDMAFVCLKK
jgi:SAM-dependent methyltransferase